MKKYLMVGVTGAAIGTLGLLGGCEVIAVQALNMIETTEFVVDNDTLYMSGEINSKTDTQFVQVITANPQITTIVECGVPGSLDDDTMIALSYQVRDLGLNTHLTSQSVIASGGVDFFWRVLNAPWSPARRLVCIRGLTVAGTPRTSLAMRLNMRLIASILQICWGTMHFIGLRFTRPRPTISIGCVPMKSLNMVC